MYLRFIIDQISPNFIRPAIGGGLKIRRKFCSDAVKLPFFVYTSFREISKFDREFDEITIEQDFVMVLTY